MSTITFAWSIDYFMHNLAHRTLDDSTGLWIFLQNYFINVISGHIFLFFNKMESLAEEISLETYKSKCVCDKA